MLTRSGVKLLDFGLAKVRFSETASGVTSLQTQTSPLTTEGTILGTLQYMAPEQLEGKEADARSDIFAFGAMLYEMASGRRAFEGKSQASLIGAIMETDPPSVSTLEPKVSVFPTTVALLSEPLRKIRDVIRRSVRCYAEANFLRSFASARTHFLANAMVRNSTKPNRFEDLFR